MRKPQGRLHQIQTGTPGCAPPLDDAPVFDDISLPDDAPVPDDVPPPDDGDAPPPEENS